MGLSDKAKMLPKLLISGDWVPAGKETSTVILKYQSCLHKWTLLNYFMLNRVSRNENVQEDLSEQPQPPLYLDCFIIMEIKSLACVQDLQNCNKRGPQATKDITKEFWNAMSEAIRHFIHK